MADKRPKILPPTLRDKKRYIAFEVVSDGNIGFGDIVNGVRGSCLSFLGELGCSRAKIWISKDLYVADKKRGVVKCAHNSVDEVKLAISLVSQIGDSRIILHVLGVTGTMRAARSKYLGLKDAG